MTEYFRVNKEMFECLEPNEQDQFYKRYVAQLVSKYLEMPQKGKTTDVVLRIISQDHYRNVDSSPFRDKIFQIDVEVIRPIQPKTYQKSKDEILIELKILIMTYINDLARDLTDLTEPIKSADSWKHIKNFIDREFYKSPEVYGKESEE